MKTTKTILILAFSVFVFASCKQTKQGTVEDLISATAKYDKEKTGNLLADNFTYYEKNAKPLNKTEYLNRLDSIKDIEYKNEIVSVQDLDSIIKTEETISMVFDSLMEGNPKMTQKKTYRFIDNKIKSITLDSTLNYEKYTTALNEKLHPILYYIWSEYDVQDPKDVFKNIRKYFREFGCLSQSDKNKYKSYSRVQGTYVGDGFFNKFIFKKEHCNFEYFGIGMSGKYTIEEDFVYIETGNGELGNVSLKIIDDNTLQGEGWATGTFKKVN